MIWGLPVHIVSPPLRVRDESCSAAQIVGAALQGTLAPCLIVTPAGIAQVETEDDALEEAEHLRSVARITGTAMIFGIDVGPPQPGASRLFACFGGAPVLWPIQAERGFPRSAEKRIISVGGTHVLPLFAAEALDPLAPKHIAKLGGVGAIFVLSHGGATTRWAAALARLETLAPLLVSTHHGGVGRGYASPALKVSWLVAGEQAKEAACA